MIATLPGPPDRRQRRAALLLGLIAALAAIAVPLAPVTQNRVTMTWPAAGADPAERAAAIPLMPYQPVQLAASIPCGAATDIVLLSTAPPRPDPGAPQMRGLRVERAAGALIVHSQGHEVARTAQPPGPCALEVRSDPDRTVVTLNGQQINDVTGDVRPEVAGAFTEAPTTAGLTLQLVTDTRFQSSMTVLKAILMALSGLALLGALLLVAWWDNHSDRTRRAPPSRPGRWLPRPVDAVVIGGLALWALIGPINVDDGYVAGIIRSRDTSGYIGNLHRWLNAPEAPFGWFYELFALWSRVSAAPLWMRIPCTLLGVISWLLLSRALLPRLGSFTARPAIMWVTAAAFGLWWLPFNLGLRSESWIAVAGLITWLAVERALVTRRLLPVLLGLVAAAGATAVAPTGIVAFTPFLAGLVPLLRALRQRPELPRLTLLVLLIAAPSSALLLAFADQTLASVVEATRIRNLVGGGLPWYQELQRYVSLLTPDSIEGPLQRRVPVLLTLLGLAAIAWYLRHRPVAGLGRGPVARVAMTFALSLAAMTFAPTKWTNHFGAVAGVGSAVLVVALYACSRQALAQRSAPARSLAVTAIGTAALAVAGGTALAGLNQWPYVSNYGIRWSIVPPHLGSVDASVIVVVGGLLLASIAGAAAAWALAGGRPARIVRLCPSPGPLALVLALATVALQFGTVALAGIEQRRSYSLAADSVAVLSHLGSAEPVCGVADHVQVETSPQDGLLPEWAASPGTMDGFIPVAGGQVTAGPGTTAGFRTVASREVGPVDAAGAVPLEMGATVLPGWVAARPGPPVRGNTAWYRLSDPARHGTAPVVITISGELRPGSTLTAELGRTGRGVAEVTPLATIPLTDQPSAPAARDVRFIVPDPAADLVRLSVSAQRDPGTVPLAFAQPRVPHTRPMDTVLPPGTTAVADWPVAFLFPCLTIAGTPDGTAELPSWRLSPPAHDKAGDIVIAPLFGGPFSASRALVRVTQMPVYLNADPMREILTLQHWQPLTSFGHPAVSREREVVGGWQRHGHLHVPGLDS